MRPDTMIFQLPLNGSMYAVKATPYEIPSSEPRFRVSINDSPIYIFGWDNDLDRLSVKGDAPATLSGNLEMAIAGQLRHKMQLHAA